MTQDHPGIEECVRRLNELTADVALITATLHALQLQSAADMGTSTGLALRRGSSSDHDECLRRIRQRSKDLGVASRAIAEATERMLLELGLLRTFTRRRGRADDKSGGLPSQYAWPG